MVGELVALLTSETLPVAVPAVVDAKTTLKLAVCPAAKVSGAVRPLAVKPLPETLICEMLTLELPELVRVTVCGALLLPTVTFPKLRLVGLAVRRKVEVTPVPLNAMVEGELGASLTSERLPVTLPALAGAKATLKLVLCPALRDSGTVRPVMLKPFPEGVACEMVTLAVPELIRVMVWELRVPTATSPKLALGGTTESCGWSGWTPMPLRAIVVRAEERRVGKERRSRWSPYHSKTKTTLKVVFCPGVRVRGKLSPARLRPLPETLAWETVTLALPELVRVKA